jgi:hypothetical protein
MDYERWVQMHWTKPAHLYFLNPIQILDNQESRLAPQCMSEGERFFFLRDGASQEEHQEIPEK